MDANLASPEFRSTYRLLHRDQEMHMSPGLSLDSNLLPDLKNPSLTLEEPSAARDILLVHGAFTDGSVWAKLIPRLEARRLRVSAAQIPLTSLHDDVIAMQRILALQPGPALLVGHGWGGAVITQAGLSPSVLGLVYVAAFVPDAGESVNDMLLRFAPTDAQRTIHYDDAGFTRLSPEGFFESFAHKLPMQERRLLMAVQPQSNKTIFDQRLTQAAWRAKPSWHVIAEQDRMLAPAMQWDGARRSKGKVIPVPTCHVPMLEEPEMLADVIAGAAASFRHDL